MANIIHLKLQTGEEIIGMQSKETTNAYYLEKVRVIGAQQLQNGSIGIGFIPFLIGNPDGEVRIPDVFVMGEPLTDLPKNMENGYLQQVSGLDLSAQGTGKIQL